MSRYAVALGSNLGDRCAHLRSALEAIKELAIGSVAVSSLYETAPVGGPAQPPYLNAVAVFQSEMDPHQLLSALNAIEQDHGREREEHWGPRTLDLDIVAADQAVDDPPRLMIPHPRAHERRFVLEPLVEVWPEASVEATMPAWQALEGSLDQEVDRLGGPWWVAPKSPSGRFWVAAQILLFGLIGVSVVVQGSLPNWNGWRIAGAVLMGLGALVLIWSGLALGSNTTALPDPVSGGRLIESGPYRMVRHPMYSSVILLLVGLSLFTTAPVAIGISLSLIYFFRLKADYEESLLRMTYADYRDYKSRVTWWLIPGLE